MSAYSLGAYTNDRALLAQSLGIPEKSIFYFNSSASVGKPACFLAVDHQRQE